VGEQRSCPEDLDERLQAFMGHAWGVSRGKRDMLAHLEMTVYVGDGESHIPGRLNREKRCGRVEQLDEHHWRYTAEVCDALEMLPWIRTFTGRITALKCDDPQVTERFYADMAALAEMYGR
jgi:hypothetical protein